MWPWRFIKWHLLPLPWKTQGANVNPSVGDGAWKLRFRAGFGGASAWEERDVQEFVGPTEVREARLANPRTPAHPRSPDSLGRASPDSPGCGAYRRRSAAAWVGPGGTDRRSRGKVSRSNRRSPWRGSRRSWRSCSASCLPWGGRARRAAAGAGSAWRGGPPARGLRGLPERRAAEHGPPPRRLRALPRLLPPLLLPPPPRCLLRAAPRPRYINPAISISPRPFLGGSGCQSGRPLLPAEHHCHPAPGGEDPAQPLPSPLAILRYWGVRLALPFFF